MAKVLVFVRNDNNDANLCQIVLYFWIGSLECEGGAKQVMLIYLREAFYLRETLYLSERKSQG